MIIKRLKLLLISHGFIGLIGFILSRLVRVTHENIYQRMHDETLESLQYLKLVVGWKSHIIDRTNFEEKNNIALLESLYHGEVETYINGIKADSILFAITDGKVVIHTSFVQFKTRYKSLIHEESETPLIGNCWTKSRYRGKALFSSTINLAVNNLFKRNYQRVLISCASNNIASIKGIEKANFQLVQKLKSYILLNKFVLQISTKNELKSIIIFTF